MSNLFAADLEKLRLTDLEGFLGLSGPEDQRPPEGSRIDFKESLPSDIGDDVAAMSNSYGGLILIGVKSSRKKGNIPIEFSGVDATSGDVRARITDRILATVHPRPEFEIAVLATQGTNRAIVVIRVREGSFPPYEHIRGATVRIPVRIQDTNRQATVREIEALLAKRKTAGSSPQELVSDYIEARVISPLVWTDGENYKGTPAWQKIIVVPQAPLDLRIDTSLERHFERLVIRHFPKDRKYLDYVVRMASFSVFASRDKQSARRWGIWSSGAIAFCRNLGGSEAVGDLAAYLIFTCRLAHSFLESRHYYGNVVLAQEISCQGNSFVPTFPPPGGYTDYDLVDGIRFPRKKPELLPSKTTFVKRVEWTDLDKPDSLVAIALLNQLRDSWAADIQFDKLLEAISRLSQDSTNRDWGTSL